MEMGISEIEKLGSFGLKILGISGEGVSKCYVFDVENKTFCGVWLALESIGPFSSASNIGTGVDLRSTSLTLDNAKTSLALLSLNRNVNLLTVNRPYFYLQGGPADLQADQVWNGGV